MKKIVSLFVMFMMALGAQAQSVDNVNSNAAKESVYDQVEVKPEFPGGMPALVKYLQENIKYPSAALEEKAQGKAFVRFVVEKDGSITNTEIIKSTGNIYLDKEALRVASNMPKWKPGMQQGKPVRVFFMLPVSFKL
jgi:protein TonB